MKNISLFSLMGKNFKILARSKWSALAIIVVPLLVILVVGSAFNSSGLTGVTLGTYSSSYTPLSESLLKSFESQGFLIQKFDSNETCIDAVKMGKVQSCAIFPEDFSEEGSLENILIYVDHSRINLAYSLINEIESKVSDKSSGIGVSMVEDLIKTLNSVKKTLNEEKTSLSNSKEYSSEITQISEGKSSISNLTSEINSSISLINSLNDSETKTSLLTSMNILKGSTTTLSKKLGDVNSKSNDLVTSLDDSLSKIDKIIAEIDKSNAIDAEKIISPIKTQVVSVNSNSNNRDYILPTILTLIALFGGMLLSSSFVLKERKTKAYFRNLMTPTWNLTFVFANYLTCLSILIFQFILILAGIEWFFGKQILGLLPEISLVLFFSLSAFIFIGIFIGYLFKSEETVIFAAVFVAALMMFFSNTILPIETFLSEFKNFANFNPVVLSSLALKKIISFNYGLDSILNSLYYLGGFSIVFLILSLIGRKMSKEIL